MAAKKRLRAIIIPLACLVIALLIFESKIKDSTLFDLASDFFKNEARVIDQVGRVKIVKLNLIETRLWRDKARIGLKLTGENGSIPAWAWLKKNRK